MKRILLVAFLMMLTAGITAQKPHGGNRQKEQFRIENIVGDLSAAQKRRLNAINEESQKVIEQLRNEHKAVRDSIHAIMEQSGDQTALLSPMFDREGDLQAAISKQMYATRLRIEEVLTDEQNALVKKYFVEKRAQSKNGHKRAKKEKKEK